MATIGVDVSDLCTGRADGTTRATAELVRRLPALMSDHGWKYLAPCSAPSTFSAPTFSGNKLSSPQWVCSPWPKYWTQLRLPLSLYQEKIDLLFMPIQQLPILRPGRMGTVAIIHDLAIHYYPEQFTFKDWWLLRLFSAQAAREADHIIVVSQATADDVARWYGRTDNVHIIHHGVDHSHFHSSTAAERARAWSRLRQHYGDLEKGYLLYVGQIQPRKNLICFIEACEQLPAKQGRQQLVIVGGEGWLQKPILARIRQSKRQRDILVLGRVPDDLLPALYWHASVFVLPSLYEGFGLPIVEAMASGCPVVTSNVSSMPEVAGGAAVLIDPFKVESIRQGIIEAEVRRSDLIAKGLVRAKQFTWDKTAAATANVLRLVDAKT